MNTGLAATIQEEGGGTLPVGVLGCHTILHVTVARHSYTTDTSADEGVHTSLVVFECSPPVGFVHEIVKVKGKTVTYTHETIRISKVVLYAWVIGIILS